MLTLGKESSVTDAELKAEDARCTVGSVPRGLCDAIGNTRILTDYVQKSPRMLVLGVSRDEEDELDLLPPSSCGGVPSFLPCL